VRANPSASHRPVLVVGSSTRVALGVSRSLHAHGIPVIVASVSSDEGAIPSRSIRRHIQLPDASERPDEFDEALLSAVRATNADLLVACSDVALSAIARNYDRLKKFADPGCPIPAVIDRVLDKNVTFAAARTLGINVPETHDLAAIAASGELAGRIEYPVIAKARSRVREGGFRIRYYDDAAQLEAAIAADPSFAARHVVQRWVPGRGEGVCILMHRGEAVAVFQHRRLKELPSSGGVTVIWESIEREKDLSHLSIALLRAIEWEGVAFVEFRRHESGTPWLMEVNGRYWGGTGTAVAAGVDFPFYQWQVSHGINPVVPPEYTVGLRVRWTRASIMRFRERAFDSSGRRGLLARFSTELAEFSRDFGRGTRSLLWSPRDPFPAILDALPAVGKFASSAIRAFGRELLPGPLRRAFKKRTPPARKAPTS
jgi:predicted ATP-grasp superfamily ATP-dependent carboligase